jgi:glycosyltransferase involved in cell wall biosynthesis
MPQSSAPTPGVHPADRFPAHLVHGIAWMAGRLGYNVHARGFFTALARRFPTVVSPLVMLDGPFREDRRHLEHVARGRPIATIALMYGSFAAAVTEGAPGSRIAYTVWESTRLPDDWLGPLAAMDQVWVPSPWGASVLADNGIDAGRLHVVPEGIDPLIFHPAATPATVIAGKPGFKFLNVGRFETRKHTGALIQAFDREFGPGDDALLVLACDNPVEPGFDIARRLRELRLRHPEKLLFVPPVGAHHLLAALYTACDAFVSPSRAEGWGLPITEAMACGLPVIVTGYSAPLSFVGSDGYLIDHTLVPIEEPYFESASGDYGLWAEPDIGHLRHLMREVFQRRADARARGMAASARIRRDFTWDAAARQAASILSAG